MGYSINFYMLFHCHAKEIGFILVKLINPPAFFAPGLPALAGRVILPIMGLEAGAA
jgi:hypothetical protein